MTACAVCAHAQMATSVASGEDFSRQLAALQGQLAAAEGDLALQRRVVATMRSLVLEASRSLFDLPRLETAVRGVVAGEAELRRDVAQLRAALAAAEARHAAELRAQREAMEASEMRWTASLVAERAAYAKGMAVVNDGIAAHLGWRPYPKDAAMSAAEDAGLKHGGSIRDDAITASSERLPEVVDGMTITVPVHMCRLGKPVATTDTTLECSFSPTDADAATGRAWVQVRLVADDVEPVFACGAVMTGCGTEDTNFTFCWKGTAFQVSMDGEEWTKVAGGEVSTDGRATWTPVSADGIFRRTAAMTGSDHLDCRWDVAHRCRCVRAVLKEEAASGASQMQWEVLKLKAGV
jgi:hypothetical protein